MTSLTIFFYRQYLYLYRLSYNASLDRYNYHNIDIIAQHQDTTPKLMVSYYPKGRWIESNIVLVHEHHAVVGNIIKLMKLEKINQKRYCYDINLQIL